MSEQVKTEINEQAEPTIADAVEKIAEGSEIKYGPTNDGEYITPYQMTVVFHENSSFEYATAILGDRTQMIPIYANCDYEAVAASCEHISPEVLIFGTEFSRAAISKFFERGFHFVHVFARDVKAAEAIYYDNDQPFDHRMIVFGIDTFYEHTVLLKGIAPVYVLEHFARAEFPQYAGILDDKGVTHLAGKYLVAGLEGENFAQKVLQLGSSFKCFEEVARLVIKGRTVYEFREKLANQKLFRAALFQLKTSKKKIVSAIALEDFGIRDDLLQLLPAHPVVVKNEVQLVVLYHQEPRKEKDIQNGFQVTFVSIKDLSALETLRKFAPETVTGSQGVATAWIPSAEFARVIGL